MMAAGHPRVSFELDLYSALQRHYDFDADYASASQLASGVKYLGGGPGDGGGARPDALCRRRPQQ